MDFITWDQSFSVGVELIDGQHKKLFEIINKLHKTIKKTDVTETEMLGNIIQDLAAYVDFHFKTEEKYFNKFGYEKTVEHTAQHNFYEERIKNFKEQYEEKGESIGDDILVFLEEWIKGHIKIKDKEYTKCFNEHGLV